MFVLAGALGLGCGGLFGGNCDEWQREELELGVDDDLHGVTILADERMVVVGANGLIRDGSEEMRPVEATLRGVAGGDIYVTAVGDGGTLVRRPFEGGAWEAVDLGVTADLYAIGEFRDDAIVVGDDMILVQKFGEDAWVAPKAPPGGWGELRGVFQSSNGFYVAVGRGGVAWTSDSPAVAWTSLPVDTDEDLLGGGHELIVGTGGFACGMSGNVSCARWELDYTEGHDLLGYACDDYSGCVLLVDEVGVFDGGQQIATETGMLALASRGAESRTIIVVGRGGKAVRLKFEECTGIG